MEYQLSYMDCPVIDLSLLVSSSSSVAAMDEQAKLLSALKTWGSFQLVNHGISGGLMDELRNVSKQFMDLPLEEKEKVSRTETDSQGYGKDSIVSDKVPVKWHSRLFLITHPEDQRKLERWPQNPPKFRGIVDEFTTKARKAHGELVQAIARCLGLEERTFLDEYGGEDMQTITRFNFYTPCPYIDLVRTTSKHADSFAVTFLMQDKELEGLEVLRDDQWFKVSVIPHALLVNIGDQMEIMSNGILKSVVHRVVPTLERERISVAIFCGANTEKEIGPVKGLVSQDQPALYKRVKNYGQYFFRYHPTGVRAITIVKK